MRIAIAGYGIEGKASYEYWQAFGHDVTIVDERELNPFELPYGNEPILGKNAFKKLDGFDIVIRTASLEPSRIKTTGKVWSATNEFFSKCPAPIIGVTGTKGKGTTASLITSILQAAGKTVHLVGNIGVPALGALEIIGADDIVVFELSSFQLWDLEVSPYIAVVLMIEPDHLDVHKDIKDYINAKANIRRHQGLDDICIYHPTNRLSHQIAMTGNWPEDEQELMQWQEQAFRYGIPDDNQVYVKENTFFVQNRPICSADAVQLPGVHILENACAAISAARHYTINDKAIEKGLKDFTGLPHRLKKVRELGGVTYYDDSIATTPGSAIAAIQSFQKPKLLILGGKDKGADYTQLIKRCQETGTQVLAVGTSGKLIAKLCRKHKVEVTEETGDMSAIVAAAQKLAKPGSCVILSPAAASFDMFRSYADRGEQFVQAVEALS